VLYGAIHSSPAGFPLRQALMAHRFSRARRKAGRGDASLDRRRSGAHAAVFAPWIALPPAEGHGSVRLFWYSVRGAVDPDTRTEYLIVFRCRGGGCRRPLKPLAQPNKIVESLREWGPTATPCACRNEPIITQGVEGARRQGSRRSPTRWASWSPMRPRGPERRRALCQAARGRVVQTGTEAIPTFRYVALRPNRRIGQDPLDVGLDVAEGLIRWCTGSRRFLCGDARSRRGLDATFLTTGGDCRASEYGHSDGGPRHEVTIGKAFAVGRSVIMCRIGDVRARG